MNASLTPKQQCFVDEYLIDLNATQAAIRAGYSEKTAKQQASRLLTIVDVAAAVAEAKQERSEATKIDAEWVLRQAVELHRRCMQEIRPANNPKTGKQIHDDKGNALFTFNAAAASRALELIGKHIEVAAFKERLEVSNDGFSLEERLQAGRRRAGKTAEDDKALTLN
jgi:phage terminase small subunit